MAKPRLFVEPMLIENRRFSLTGDAHHYLTRVMRLKAGDEFVVFDGQSDSQNARILSMTKRELSAEILGLERAYLAPPDLELAFAPIKKALTDFIVEKATELGVRSIQAVKTDYTNSERLNIERLGRHAIEAAEQCGGNFVPKVHDWVSLEDYLQTKRQIVFCDETASASEGLADFATLKAQSWSILIGPEGGFSPLERERIRASGAYAISLGPRILRADTAAIAAISLWQNTHGDW